MTSEKVLSDCQYRHLIDAESACESLSKDDRLTLTALEASGCIRRLLALCERVECDREDYPDIPF